MAGMRNRDLFFIKEAGKTFLQRSHFMWNLTEGGPLVQSVGREHESRTAQTKAVDGKMRWLAFRLESNKREKSFLSNGYLVKQGECAHVGTSERRSLNVIPSALRSRTGCTSACQASVEAESADVRPAPRTAIVSPSSSTTLKSRSSLYFLRFTCRPERRFCKINTLIRAAVSQK